MADLKPGFNPLFLREEDLREGMELLFFAYRDFVDEADRVLERHDLGRAHHRALYFIGRHPGISVSELLRILKITKQSLSRVIGELTAKGLIEQKTGLRDRRRRHLMLTAAGASVERELTESQRTCLARAYREAGAEAVQGFRKVLTGLIRERGLYPPADAGAEARAIASERDDARGDGTDRAPARRGP